MGRSVVAAASVATAGIYLADTQRTLPPNGGGD